VVRAWLNRRQPFATPTSWPSSLLVRPQLAPYYSIAALAHSIQVNPDHRSTPPSSSSLLANFSEK
jgi:hypothetical protein